MTEQSDSSKRIIRRILVALDASPHSIAAVEAAARLAADFEAKLEGLFVEDVDLIRTADLPFVREVCTYPVSTQTMSSQRLERQLRQQAQRARRILETVAHQTNVKFDFRVTRGRVATELLKAAAEADLLTLGKASGPSSSRRKLGTTARRVLAEAPASVLVLHREARPGRSILTYFDGSSKADRALQLAIELAERAPETALTVLLPARSAEQNKPLRDTVLKRAKDRVPWVNVRPLTRLEAQRLAMVAHTEDGGLVVLPAGSPPLRDDILQDFLYEVNAPVLVVR